MPLSCVQVPGGPLPLPPRLTLASEAGVIHGQAAHGGGLALQVLRKDTTTVLENRSG